MATTSFRPPSNDRLSTGFQATDLVPKKYRGTDKFLDLVTWNIRYFHPYDSRRVKLVMGVLEALNADIFVLQEILNQSLEGVAHELGRRGAGHYEVSYGTTGGNQRIAIAHDLDWVRAKDTVTELFGKGALTTPEGKDAFPRLPLQAYFTGLSPGGTAFDFQLVGLHLKSQRGGGADQRRLAANALATWLTTGALRVDADVIMTGDWNEPPLAATWLPFHALEEQGNVLFRQLNNSNEISHLMFSSKSDLGSRLDLTAVSMASAEELGRPPSVVRWIPLSRLLDTNPKAAMIKKFLKELSHNVSDHMPVVTRFFFEEKSATPPPSTAHRGGREGSATSAKDPDKQKQQP